MYDSQSPPPTQLAAETKAAQLLGFVKTLTSGLDLEVQNITIGETPDDPCSLTLRYSKGSNPPSELRQRLDSYERAYNTGRERKIYFTRDTQRGEEGGTVTINIEDVIDHLNVRRVIIEEQLSQEQPRTNRRNFLKLAGAAAALGGFRRADEAMAQQTEGDKLLDDALRAEIETENAQKELEELRGRPGVSRETIERVEARKEKAKENHQRTYDAFSAKRAEQGAGKELGLLAGGAGTAALVTAISMTPGNDAYLWREKFKDLSEKIYQRDAHGR